MLNKGKFIVLEGTEGCGKTSTWNSLKALYPDALFVREPGNTKLGERIRAIIFEEERSDITDAYLFAVARAESINTIVKPALDSGKMVISDRSFLTSVVYQGIVGGLTAETVMNINREAMQGIVVSKAIVFDIDYETAISRAHRRGDAGGELNRFDNSAAEFYQKSINGFHQIPSLGINTAFVDARKTQEEVLIAVDKIIKETL